MWTPSPLCTSATSYRRLKSGTRDRFRLESACGSETGSSITRKNSCTRASDSRRISRIASASGVNVGSVIVGITLSTLMIASTLGDESDELLDLVQPRAKLVE